MGGGWRRLLCLDGYREGLVEGGVLGEQIGGGSEVNIGKGKFRRGFL